MVIADTSAKLDKDGKFIDEYVSARKALQPTQVMASEVTHMDAAHKEILGVAASMIPFVEKNRVDRSLMACAMQKQAVPLIKPEAAIVSTGIDGEVAKNLSQIVYAEDDGEVVKADSNVVEVKYKKETKAYNLIHFMKTNDDRCYDERVVVKRGQKVEKGDVLIKAHPSIRANLRSAKTCLLPSCHGAATTWMTPLSFLAA